MNHIPCGRNREQLVTDNLWMLTHYCHLLSYLLGCYITILSLLVLFSKDDISLLTLKKQWFCFCTRKYCPNVFQKALNVFFSFYVPHCIPYCHGLSPASNSVACSHSITPPPCPSGMGTRMKKKGESPWLR